MSQISWVDIETNEVVLNRPNDILELLTIVSCRKSSYIRGERYRILQLTIKGEIDSRRRLGRKQVLCLKNVGKWTGIRITEQLFRMTKNREELARVDLTWYFKKYINVCLRKAVAEVCKNRWIIEQHNNISSQRTGQIVYYLTFENMEFNSSCTFLTSNTFFWMGKR